MADIAGLLSEVVGPGHVLTGDAIADDYGHDEALTATPQHPEAVVRPATADEVSRYQLKTMTDYVAKYKK